MTEKQIVHRIEDGMDRQDVLATTYQMRNFYRQLADGYFSPLDVFNYIQHHWIASRLVNDGARVLDVCCGRGLMLPLLRYHAKPSAYVGIDIEPKNAVWAQGKRVTDGKDVDDGYYEFTTELVVGNVAEMATLIRDQATVQEFDLIVYTSSIEHMHPDAGMQSLRECRAVAAQGARMIVTCPNTPEGQDGYDTRYRAHVYEWKRSELLAGLQESGWNVLDEWGIHIGATELKKQADRLGTRRLVDRVRRYVPNEWLLPVLAPLYPAEAASEIAVLASAV